MQYLAKENWQVDFMVSNTTCKASKMAIDYDETNSLPNDSPIKYSPTNSQS